MQGVVYALAGTGFTCLMTMLGAAFVFLLGREIGARMERVCLGFASGVMSAAAVFSLLLPAVEEMRARGGHAVLTVSLGFFLGAGLLLAAGYGLDRGGRAHGEAEKRRFLMIAAVTLHNIPEGMAVGLAFAAAAQAGGAALASAAVLALGIGVQNLPEGAAVSLPLYQGGLSRRVSFLLGSASGMVEPAFGLAAAVVSAGMSAALPVLMAASAGAMMAVVAQEMLPEAAGDRRGVLFFIAGYVLMMALDVALG